MTPARTAALIAAILTLQQASGAADWRFCIAPNEQQNRIYISAPFAAIGPRAEGEFGDMLTRRRLAYDSVQCPRADDESSAFVMRQHALDVNRLWGRRVIDLNWRPQP